MGTHPHAEPRPRLARDGSIVSYIHAFVTEKSNAMPSDYPCVNQIHPVQLVFVAPAHTPGQCHRLQASIPDGGLVYTSSPLARWYPLPRLFLFSSA